MRTTAGKPVPVIDAVKQCAGDKLYMSCTPKNDHVNLDTKLGRVWIKPTKDAKRIISSCAFVKKNILGK